MEPKSGTDITAATDKIHWFEFLLDDSLLERHLGKDNPSPSAGELISLFLYQADIAANTAREIAAKENAAQAENPQLLSAMIQSLLLEFLKVTSPEEDLTLKHPKSLDMGSLAPQALFALLLYHRWCLRTVVQETFPTKPSKTVNVQVPGILDPSVTSTNMKDAVLQSVREGLEDSVTLLEKYVAQSRDVSLPQPASIGAVVFGDMVGHDWTLVTNVSGREMLAQVNFDLGSHYFCQQIYPKALSSFVDVDNILTQMKLPVFCAVDDNKLQGYLCACRGVVTCMSDKSNSQQKRSLLERMEECFKIGFEGAVEILREDNRERHLSLSYRACIQNAVHNKYRQSYGEVVVLNAIRKSLEGHMTHPNLLTCLQNDQTLVNKFIQEIGNVIETSSWEEKINLRVLVRFVHKQLKAKDSQQKVEFLTAQIKQLLDGVKDLDFAVTEDDKKYQQHFSSYLPLTGDNAVEMGKMVRSLLVSYDPAEIKSLVQQIHPKLGKTQTMFLSDKWQISRELHKGIENMPVPNPTIQVYSHILLAKARLCLKLMQYETARRLLTAADTAVRDVAYKLSKLIRQEMLYADLTEHQNIDMGEGVDQDMIKKVKSTIGSTSLEQTDSGVEIAVMCSAFLLNVKEWDYLAALPSRNIGYIEISKLLANLCKELPMLKNARIPGRELWDAIVQIFTSPPQQKRSGGGGGRDVQHDPVQGILTAFNFTSFICKIREPLILSSLISCLTKLINIIKDETTEISSDFVHLWPAATTNQVNVSSVVSSCEQLLSHALTVNPSSPSWLCTRGDLSFAHNLYTEALQAYLTLGVVTTDYFTETITKNVYDEQVYKRMIKCCNYLNCHTQVAVLCQCLDEADHAQAFKSLQEKVSNDAMDTYYPFIWDITILEYLIYLHGSKAEVEKKQFVMKLIGQLELNNSNPAEILHEAARLRKGKFFQTLASQYL